MLSRAFLRLVKQLWYDKNANKNDFNVIFEGSHNIIFNNGSVQGLASSTIFYGTGKYQVKKLTTACINAELLGVSTNEINKFLITNGKDPIKLPKHKENLIVFNDSVSLKNQDKLQEEQQSLEFSPLQQREVSLVTYHAVYSSPQEVCFLQ